MCGALQQTSCAFPSGSSGHFPELFPSTAREPFLTQQEWDGTKGSLNSSFAAKVSEEHNVIIMFKPSREWQKSTAFSAFHPSPNPGAPSHRNSNVTATNEAKNFLLANFVLSWDDPKTFQVLIVQCSNWAAQNKHGFYMKEIYSFNRVL